MVLCKQMGSTSNRKNTTTIMLETKRAGHYLDLFETPTHHENGRLRKPDDCLPRRALKDLFNQKEIGLEQPETIKKFSHEFYVD